MKWRWSQKRGVALFLGVLFLVAGLLTDSAVIAAETKEKTVDIVFTSDVHSHLDSFVTLFEGEQTQIGGFARIKTLIDRKKAENPETLYVDAGDFSMGTLIQTVYEDQAAELRMLGMLGCEATTLGNHEFDYRSNGLISMLGAAKNSGDPVPALLVCNLDWENADEEQTMVRQAFDAYGVKPYTIVEKNGVNIALIGVFGKDALACAPTCALKFSDPVTAVKQTVAEIEKKEDADMIVCLSHGGITDNLKTSEDEILAKEVPQLDLIISGHSHTALKEYVQYGDTYIVACGEYGEYLGYASMKRKEDGRWEMAAYSLRPVTPETEVDETVQGRIDQFMESVDELYLDQYGYTGDQVLAYNQVAFSRLLDLYENHTEQNLGSIMADAYLYGARTARGQEEKTFDIAVVPSGTIRDTYTTGKITVSDVFNSFSLGIGPDGIPGYPLINVYLTGAELKTVAEIDASVSDYMTSARLFMSGLHFTYNPNRMILNRVTEVKLVNSEGAAEELEDKRLYSIVADLYSGQMLAEVTGMSYGLLSVVPKDAQGNPIEDFEKAIIYDGDQEMKAWVSIARYMQSFPENEEGVPEVPESYGQEQGRKKIDDSKNIFELVKNPNKYAMMIIGVVLLAIVLVILLIALVVKLVRRIRRKGRTGKNVSYPKE